MLDKSVSGLARYYDTTGLLGESIQVLGQTAAMLEAGGPKPIVDTENSPSNQVLLSKLLAIQAAAMVKQGKFDEGMALAQKAATVGAAVGGIEGEVYGQMVVGQGLYRKGHYQEAHLHFTELLRLIARHQSQKDTLELLNDAEYTAHIWLGATKTETGDFAAAENALLRKHPPLPDS